VSGQLINQLFLNDIICVSPVLSKDLITFDLNLCDFSLNICVYLFIFTLIFSVLFGVILSPRLHHDNLFNCNFGHILTGPIVVNAHDV
jgi:hypothetical protein